MKKFEEIERAIIDRWGADPAVHICHLILSYVVSKPEESSVMLTYGDFGNITKTTYHDEELQKAIAILVSRFRALDLRLVFFDHNDEAHYLDEDEQSEFIETGELADPNSGDIVEDAKARIYPYYLADPKFLLQEVQR